MSRHANLPKRQHVVAQMLQARFADDDGTLYFFDRRATCKEVIQATPINLFVEQHIYSMITEDGAKDPALELFYSGIEDRANQIIEKIVTAARAKAVPALTREEKHEWDNFVHHQWKRSPDFHQKAWDAADFENSLQMAVNTFVRENRQLTHEERDLLQSESGKKQLRQNATVGALLNPGNLVAQALDSYGLGIARIKQPNKSFIIGSFPIVKLTNLGATIFSPPTTEIWLPISYDVAVTPTGKKGREQFVVLSDERQIRAINLEIANQSIAIAGRSRALVESLANPR